MLKTNSIIESGRVETTFQPYVCAITERAYPPLGQIHLAVFSQHLKRLQLPADVLATTLPEQVEHVRRITAAHTIKCRGRIPPFGMITGYAFCRTPEDAVMFDVEGNVANWFGRVPAEGRVAVREYTTSNSGVV